MGRQTFSSLANPNYRRYFTGQAISMIGSWMQIIAQSWLVLQLSGSATALGVVTAIQTLPVLFLGTYSGVIADRYDKRRLLMMLQAVSGVLALVLGILTLTHRVTLWQVFALALLLGLVNCFVIPARQSFTPEMVSPAELRNASSLNSVVTSCARAIGPSVAGIVIAAGGIGLCFILNALSFIAVIVSLARLDSSLLHQPPRTARAPGQVREGLRYVRRTPKLLIPLVMMAIVGCLAYEFQVVLPVLARDSFGKGPETYGFMTAAMGVGSVVGGLFMADRARTGLRAMTRSAALFTVALVLSTIATTLWLELAALFCVGAVSVGFLSQGSTTLQLGADPTMRGRVAALWSVSFQGTTPIGGPIAGEVTQHFGGRAGLVLAAAACAAAACLGWSYARRPKSRTGKGIAGTCANAGISATRESDNLEGCNHESVRIASGHA
jgi:MFS family permease